MWFKKNKPVEIDPRYLPVMKRVNMLCMMRGTVYQKTGSEKNFLDDPDRMIAYHLGALDAAFIAAGLDVRGDEFWSAARAYGMAFLFMTRAEADACMAKALLEMRIREADLNNGSADFDAWTQN